MADSTLDLVGTHQGQFVLSEQIASGPYSRSFLARRGDTDEFSVFKVAKSQSECARTSENIFQTESRVVMEGGTAVVHPNCSKLLKAQYHRLKHSSMPPFVKTFDNMEISGSSAYSMEFLGRKSVRQEESVPTKLLAKLARELHEFSVEYPELYHGDIKPENMILHGEGEAAAIHLIDPGFYGELMCEEGLDFNIAVTTPIYYPFMRPDDLLAFGIVLWELACGQHPLDPALLEGPIDNIGETLKQWTKQYENVGQYFLSPITHLRLPGKTNPAIGAGLEAFLLQAIRLQVDADGLLQCGPGFESFEEFADVLEQLADQNVLSL